MQDPRLFAVAALSLSLLLGACGTPPESPETGPAPTTPEAAEAAPNLHQQALEMVGQGRVLAAIRLYTQLAEESPSPQKEKILLDNVALLLEHGYPELAQDTLAPLELQPLDPELDIYRRSLRSQLALTLGQTQLALDTLPAPESASTANVGAHILLTRAHIYERLGRTTDSLRDLARVESLTGDPTTLQRLREDLWRQIQPLPDELLASLSRDPDAPSLSGWANLALTLRAAPLEPQGIRYAVARWRDAHPGHPAAQGFADNLVEELFAAQGHPERIAVLLPLSGRLSAFAAAVLDGLLSAYYETDVEQIRPQLEVIDVGEEGLEIVNAYREAVARGSGMVIGPLQKANVQRIAELGELPVPVLSLNYLDSDSPIAPSQLYQFGLLPEDEAAQAAEAAFANNLRHAVMLTPETAWGKRLRSSFARRFEELGGTVLDAAEYAHDGNDFANPIRRILHLDRSDARQRALRSTLGINPRFEPRRREDVDFVFIAADPRQARLLKPQLRFHHAADLPVYTTSSVYSGSPSRADDRDLDGLIFCDIPWLLQDALTGSARHERVANLWPEQAQMHPRLMALGMDAYEVIPYMQRLAMQRGAVFDGRSGQLSLDPRRRVHRRLDWARFDEGLPEPLHWQSLQVTQSLNKETDKDVE